MLIKIRYITGKTKFRKSYATKRIWAPIIILGQSMTSYRVGRTSCGTIINFHL